MTDTTDTKPPIRLYTRQLCWFCDAARELLTRTGFEFEEIRTDGKPELRHEIAELSGQATVPQIFVGEQSIGGYTELSAAMASGDFQRLIEAA